MSAFDLVIRGGTIVTPGARSTCDIAVVDGRIAQLGGHPTAPTVIDAGDMFVLPGALDMHVHLSAVAPTADEPPRFVDDFVSGSRAAATGGVTTLGQMSFPDDGQSVVDAVAGDLDAGGRDSLVDFVLHPGVVTATPATADHVRELTAAGHRSFKMVMLALDMDGSHLIGAVARAGREGALTLVHCEDGAIIDFLTTELVETGRGGLQFYARSRPDFTESASVARAVAMCEATGAPMLLVHLSSRAALETARRARRRGLPVHVETRPMYLHLTDEVHDGADSGRYIGMPPVRTADDVEAVWAAIADGTVDTIGSDHAPWLLRDKVDPALDLVSCRKGVADLETMVPMLFSAGVRAGRISLERLVAIAATNPAKLFGLYPTKGTIAVGADADLVVFDPTLTRTIDGATMQSRAGYSVYDGREVTGWPRHTLVRGTLVYTDGAVVGEPGYGRWLPRGPIETP